METQRRAYLYAIAAVLLWATVASGIKISLRYVDILQLLFYASVISAAAIFLILLLQGKLSLLKECSRRDYLRSVLLSLLNPFLYYIVLFKAYSLLPAQEAQPLNYTWPIMLVLLSIPLLKQRVRIRSILAILISFAGVIVIATRGELLEFRFSSLPGATLALSSSLIWALFWIYNLRDKRDAAVKLFLIFASGSLLILPLALLYSTLGISSLSGFLGVGYVGLFEMGITFVVWLKALELSSTTARVSNLIYAAPFLSLLIIRSAVGERILLSTIVGLSLIVTGILVQQRWNGPTVRG